jgi:hypothetical protein
VLENALAKLEQQAATKVQTSEFALSRPFLTGEA